MKLLENYQMLELSENVKDEKILRNLAQNLKKYRLAFYKEYKSLYPKYDNPYSTGNIASVLDISRRHYNRLENPNYISKNITLEKLIILSRIYDISLDDFFKQ